MSEKLLNYSVPKSWTEGITEDIALVFLVFQFIARFKKTVTSLKLLFCLYSVHGRPSWWALGSCLRSYWEVRHLIINEGFLSHVTACQHLWKCGCQSPPRTNSSTPLHTPARGQISSNGKLIDHRFGSWCFLVITGSSSLILVGKYKNIYISA